MRTESLACKVSPAVAAVEIAKPGRHRHQNNPWTRHVKMKQSLRDAVCMLDSEGRRFQRRQNVLDKWKAQ